ncbi:ATP-binding protein [Flexivirga caeni]|uniref:ATP-binding protein n=1 Tax=Flexivirga caeni TaxID=2294115 RepID=A0A3M9M4Z4_9MICO|nr:ATP-binding protein [Flexivirga caeni]RNI20629.1 ATP-binding protein [Flexivirga caeni]
MTRMPVAFHWSGGKDSAHALGRLLTDERYDVRCLLTTVHAVRDESTVHGLPTALLQAQAAAIGLPLRIVELHGAGLDGYNEAMEVETRRLRSEGITGCAFGDLEHSDVLQYKEIQFAPLGVKVIEPLWGMSPQECSEDFLASGIEAITVVVNAAVLDREHLGVPVDRSFVRTLPAGCDPCGEFGEFHTFTWNAPYFSSPVRFAIGDSERIERRISTSSGDQEFAYWRLHLRAVGTRAR